MARRTQKLGDRIKQGIEVFEPVQIGKKNIASNFLYQAFRGRDPHYPFKMLLIGETGSGKTSFLNLLYNCATIQALGCGFGPDGVEQFKKFNDIRLENTMEHAMQSKTNDAKRYNVEVGDLKVGIIDTPGFGDSRGLKQDKQNAEKIVNALKSEDYINCVCLIINGRDTRDTVSLKYVLSEITAILPRDILNNVIIVFSNTSDELYLNFDWKSLTEYFGKKVDNVFYIENPYCRFEKAQNQKGQLEVITTSLKKSFEDTGNVLSKLCTTIKDFPRIHTHLFVELYEKKQAIESTVFIALNEYEERAQLLYQELEEQMEASETKRQQLSNELFKAITEFETLGIARNYTKLIENQLALIDTQIEASIGPESEDLRKIRDELKKRLEVVQKAKKKY